MDLAKHLHQQAQRTNTDPTEGQKRAGNYLKGRVKAHGLPIVIENAKGSIRRGTGDDGKPWQCRLPAHYGYIRRTEGADGDHVDVFVGPHLTSRKVFVLDQNDAKTGEWDEHKVWFGFNSPQHVLSTYRKAFSDGKADKRFGHLVQMTPEEFRAWLKDGDTTQPIKRAAGGRVGYDSGGALPRVYIPTNEAEENARLLPEFDADPRNFFQRVMGEFKPPQPEQPEAPEDRRSAWQKLTGQFGERYQTWPEKVARSGATLPGDVLSGEVPQWERDPRTGEYHTSNTMVERAQDTAGMAGGTSFGALDTSAATLGAGPVRRAAALPMDEASRMARAAEQGFTTDAYHGTRAGEVSELQPSRSGEFGPGVYLADTPDNAWAWGAREGSDGVSIIPAKVKLENPKTITKQDWLKLNERLTPREIQAKFKKEGHDGIVAIGLNGVDRQIIPFDTSQIRSRFAAFDPANKGKSGLLLEDAALPGAPLAALEHAPQFFSGVQRAVEGISQPKMTGDQWLGTLSNKPGVKPEELQWTGLADFLAGKKGQPVTKQEVMDHIAGNKVELQEVVKREGAGEWSALTPHEQDRIAEMFREDHPGRHTDRNPEWEAVEEWYDKVRRDPDAGMVPDQTKYHSYQLPGGENYREMLLTLPPNKKEWFEQTSPIPGIPVRNRILDSEKPDYRSAHWDEPNILAHMRMNDRTIDGKRSLHLEEIQSDWHQQGRDKGYMVPGDTTGWTAEPIGRAGDMWRVRRADGREITASGKTADDAIRDAAMPESGVPDAPFKKTWHELALKRALREAAEKGYDRLSWTPGEAQAARYDLSKQVDKIAVPTVTEGSRSVRIDGKNGDSFKLMVDKTGKVQGHYSAAQFDGKQLSDVVGKEMADKIMKLDAPHEFAGEGLRIGGEGMKGFYDQIIPKSLEKIGKEHGVKVRKGATETKPISKTVDDRYSVTGDHRIFSTLEEAKAAASEPIYYIDIPQSLRDQAMRKGFALFDDSAIGAPLSGAEDDMKRARGGSIPHMADGGLLSDEDMGVGPVMSDEDMGVKSKPDAGALSAAGRGALQGATFNFGDELMGAREAGPSYIPDVVGPLPARTIAGGARLAYDYFTGRDPEATKTYNETVAREREANKAAAEQHPWAYHGAEIAGNIPSTLALPGGMAVRGASLANRVRQGATLGAEAGALAGAGEGEDGLGRLTGAGIGAGAGTIGGGLAAPVAEGVGLLLKKTLGPVYNSIVGMVRGPENEAARRVFTALEADGADILAGKANGMTPQQWAAARAAGEPVTLADLGSARTQSLLRSAANTSPEGRAALEKVIGDRFEGQAERVGKDVRSLVNGGANANKTADQLVAEYDLARVPAYKHAFSRPGAASMWDEDFAQMAQAPVVQQAVRMAGVNAKNEAAKLGLRPPVNPFAFNKDGTVSLTDPNFKPNLQFWDVVKKNLDKMGADGNAWSRVLRDKLDDAVPEYGNARGIAAQFFGERDALEAGRAMAGKRMDPEVVRGLMRKMSPEERDLFREGHASDWAGRVIGNFRDSRDITKAMFNSPNERKMAEVIYGPAGVKKLEARMTLEAVMDGARRALGNSTTARQLIEAGLAGGALGGYLDGDWKGAVAGAAGAAGARKAIATEMAAGARHLIGKVDAKTAARVAELLTSDDPAKLAAGMRIMVSNKRVADGMRAIADRLGVVSQNQAAPRLHIDTTGWGGSLPARAQPDQQQDQPGWQ